MYQTIVLDHSGGISIITLNRPAVLNALSTALLAELGDALRAIDADRNVRAAIVTGAGEKAFAAGADIAEFKQIDGAVAGAAFARRGQAIVAQISRMRVHVIAAVNGFALGGGILLQKYGVRALRHDTPGKDAQRLAGAERAAPGMARRGASSHAQARAEFCLGCA